MVILPENSLPVKLNEILVQVSWVLFFLQDPEKKMAVTLSRCMTHRNADRLQTSRSQTPEDLSTHSDVYFTYPYKAPLSGSQEHLPDPLSVTV